MAKHNLRVEFLFEPDKGVTRAYVWQGMQIIGKKPYKGVLSSYEKVNESHELIKQYEKELES